MRVATSGLLRSHSTAGPSPRTASAALWLALCVLCPSAPSARAAVPTGDQIIATAKQYLGVPYKFGAAMSDAPDYFDCSSFTKYVFAQHGITLNRTSYNQATQGVDAPKDALQAGDLIFMKTTSRDGDASEIDHVGIYMGGNQIIQTYGDPGVCIRDFWGTSWGDHFVTARRFIPTVPVQPITVTTSRAVVRISLSTLNVRTGYGTGYTIKGVAHADERYVQVAVASNGWRQIWWDGTLGWISGGTYSTVVSGASAIRITASSTNVRDYPDNRWGRKLGTVSRDQLYARRSSSWGWIEIWFKGARGWIAGTSATSFTP